MERDLSAVVEWLRMLSLPRWVRGALACGIAAVLATGFVLIGAELLFGRADLAAAGATLVAVAVPVAMVIVLLFAQGDHETLRRRTDALLAQTSPQAVRDLMAHATASRSVLDCAVREGYEPHASLAAQSIEGRRRLGLVLVKRVGDDNFLLKPQAALYWAQDLSFFVQGLLRSEGFDVREA
jgi:hypothetical protein